MADDINSLLADFEELEQRLLMANAQANQPLPRNTKNNPLKFDPNISAAPLTTGELASSARVAPVPAPPAVDEGSEIDFLAELEREVAAKNEDGTSDQGQNLKAQSLHDALHRIFSFLHRVSRHANQLRPEITRPYRLDTQTAYEGLRLSEAFADSRKLSLAENAFLSHVNFRMRLVAPQEITLIRRWDQLAALKKDFHILNLRLLNEPEFTKKPEQEFIKVQLAADFPLQISFKANYKAHQIDVSSRNLEGFCLSAFVLDVVDVNQALLDELGRFLLSRSVSLPKALRRVNYMQSGKK